MSPKDQAADKSGDSSGALRDDDSMRFPVIPGRVIAVFLLSFSWSAAHLLMYWPATITWDAYDYLAAFQRGDFAAAVSVESWLYGLFVYVTLLPLPNFSVTALGQILLMSVAVTYMYFILKYRMGKPEIALLAAGAMLVAPLNPMMALFMERDVPFAWVSLIIMLQLADFLLIEGERSRIPRILLLSLSLAAAAALRRDGLVLIPLAAWVVGRGTGSLERALILALSSLTLYHFLPSCLPDRPGNNISDNHNGFLRPLYYIVHNRGTPLSAEEREIISGIMDPDQVPKLNSPYDFPPHPFGDSDTEDEVGRLFGLTLRLGLENPGLFLRDRFELLRFQLSDVHLADHPPITDAQKQQYEELNLRPRTFLPGLRALHRDLLDWIIASPGVAPVLFGIMPGIIALLVLAPAAPFLTLTRWLLPLPLTHFLVVFFTQPKASYKYLYFSYISAFLLCAFAAAELGRRAGAKRAAIR